ncbi:MAG: MgtC/SapB family protein [Actinobacteria bacterium]|nr:MgtC/SapB family protein [Actinomycetota bacterium]
MIFDWQMLIKLVISAVLGGIIGLQRERAERPAGFRTHVLVCIGSTLIMLISAEGFKGNPTVDPTRIAAQVVTGIGFLGAGTIIRQGSIVKGLTTAASIWVVSAIGLAVGISYYLGAVITTILVFLVLTIFKIFEDRYLSKPEEFKINIEFDESVGNLVNLEDELSFLGIKLIRTKIESHIQDNLILIELTVAAKKKIGVIETLKQVSRIKGVLKAVVE